MTARAAGKVAWNFTVDIPGMTGDDFEYLPGWEQQELVMKALTSSPRGIIMSLDAGSEEVDIDEIKDVT